MNVTVKNLPKAQAELTITVDIKEQKPHLEAAAKRISSEIKIPGFRPGLAPYDIVVGQVGEMKILDAALETIVRETFVKAVDQNELKTIGMPEIAFEKVAPKNELVYKATVFLVPPVTLPDISKISVIVKPEPVTDEKIASVIKELQGMHAVASDTTEPATSHDQITVDMDLFDGLVPLEGGQARDHVVNLDEPYYIPGFVEKLVGTKSGDELEFVLKFPKDHYQKLYADKDINFKVKVKKVSARALPTLDDEFAKKLGVESYTHLRENVAKNIADEHQHKAEEAAEIEMLRKIVSETKFGEIPENLVDSERRKLMNELTHSLQQHGVTAEQYLSDMKKTEQELAAGFTDQAVERVKMGLLTYEFAQENKIDVTPAELQEELEAIRVQYKNNADAIKRLQSPEVQESVLNSLRNRKVVEWLSEQLIKKAE